MKLNIDRAFALKFANTGEELLQEFAKQEWPDSNDEAIRQNLKRLLSGRTDVKASTVRRICDMTGVDANFLFDLE